MPLKSNEKTKSPLGTDSHDTGYDSLDMTEESCEKNTYEDDDTDEWLQTMGIEEAQIKKINAKQVINSIIVTRLSISYLS